MNIFRFILLIGLMVLSIISSGQGKDTLQLKREKERREQDSLRKVEIEKAYIDAIKKADKACEEEKYHESINAYQVALSIKPMEKYPRDRMALIKQKLDKEAAFSALIKRADYEFEKSEFGRAYIDYESASKIKINDENVREKLINTKLKLLEQDADTLKIKSYTININNGDSCLRSENYLCARSYFTKAYYLRPHMSYSKEKKEQCERKIIFLENEAQFNKYLKLGDSCFKNYNHYEAGQFYSEALRLFPDDSTVREKFKRSETLYTKLWKLELSDLRRKYLVEEISSASAIIKLEEGLQINPLDEWIKGEISWFKEIDISGINSCDCEIIKSNADLIRGKVENLSEFQIRTDDSNIKRCGFFNEYELVFGFILYPGGEAYVASMAKVYYGQTIGFCR